MKYGDEFVKKVADSVISGSCSIRTVKRIFGVSRDTVSKWVSRTLARYLLTYRKFPEGFLALHQRNPYLVYSMFPSQT